MQTHDALGARASEILPDLYRPVALKGVRLPAYQVRLLEALASRHRVTVEEVLTRALALLPTVASEAEVERMVPCD